MASSPWKGGHVPQDPLEQTRIQAHVPREMPKEIEQRLWKAPSANVIMCLSFFHGFPGQV